MTLLLIGGAARADLSDADIRARIIHASIAAYAGNCPCPYNVDRAGRSCGQRSAWSKPRGHSLVCFPSETSDEQVKEYRERIGGQSSQAIGLRGTGPSSTHRQRRELRTRRPAEPE